VSLGMSRTESRPQVLRANYNAESSSALVITMELL